MTQTDTRALERRIAEAMTEPCPICNGREIVCGYCTGSGLVHPFLGWCTADRDRAAVHNLVEPDDPPCPHCDGTGTVPRLEVGELITWLAERERMEVDFLLWEIGVVGCTLWKGGLRASTTGPDAHTALLAAVAQWLDDKVIPDPQS